jgi:adenylate kinase family enzyme
MRRVLVTASASGNGKTTVGRELAAQLGVPFVELDSIVHGPGWIEISDAELRARLEPILAGDGWVIDGGYTRKLGRLVIDAADMIVWLDLPMRVWLPRLVRRSYRRMRGREPLWNGNRETLASLLGGRDSLFGYAIQAHFRRRREWPELFAECNVLRLRTPAEVADFLERGG